VALKYIGIFLGQGRRLAMADGDLAMADGDLAMTDGDLAMADGDSENYG